MLPKLQQSHIATSLRRDNLTSQIQCTIDIIQAKINSRISFSNKITNATNRGRITMHPKILIVLLEIFQNNTYPKKNQATPLINQSIKTLSLGRQQNMPSLMASEEKAQVLQRKKMILRSLFRNQELFKKEKSLLLSSGDTTIVEICLSVQITKILCLNWCGRWQCSLQTTTTISRYFSMELDKNWTPIAHLR